MDVVTWDSWSLPQPPHEMRRPERSTSRQKWEIRNDIAYYATYIFVKYDASGTYHKECADGDPPREPRAHELMERSVRRFALDKQKTTESVQTEYNVWKIETKETQCQMWIGCVILWLKNPGQELNVIADIAVYLNWLSIEGYKYALPFIDAATKYFW